MLLNLQQKNKTANQYTQEVEKLTKALASISVKVLANPLQINTALQQLLKPLHKIAPLIR